MVDKNVQETIITKEDTVEEKNIQRVDKRPGSIYSIVIFVLVFLIGYLFYPRISMMLPIPGQKLTVKTGYQATDITQMLETKTIVVATCSEEGDTKTKVTTDNQPLVYRIVSFQVQQVLKGEATQNISVLEYGGDGLFTTGGTKKKYTVTYENAADFEKGKTYLLFINEDGETVNGRAGAIVQNQDGTFTDVSGLKYSIDEIKGLLGG